MTFSASIMIQNLAVFVTFMQYQIVFSLPNIIFWHHISIYLTTISHGMLFNIHHALYLIAICTCRQKCEICIAQQAFQHTLTWLLKLNFSPWGLMA